MTEDKTDDLADEAPALEVARGADIALSLELEESKPPVRLSNLVFLIAGMFAIGLLWSALTPVDEVVQATGETEPEGEVIVIQHSDGGAVKALHVQESQRVRAGDVLIEFDPISVDLEIEKLTAQRDEVLLSLRREQAVRQDAQFEIDQSADPAQIFEQTQLNDAQLSQRRAQIETQRALIEEADARIDAIIRQIPPAERIKTEADANRVTIEDAFQKGFVIRERYTRTVNEANEAEIRLSKLRSDLVVQKRAKRTAESRLEELIASQRAEALSHSAALLSELAGLEAAIADLEGRKERMTVRTAVDGFVTQLRSHHAGAVLAPGSEIMRIVPEDQPLVVEARVHPRDIGRIKPDQQVTIRVSAYDYARYGSITGVIDDVSPTSIVDENGEPYYQLEVTPDKQYFGRVEWGAVLLPGMPVDIDIKKGKRSLLSYVTKPIVRGWSEAFHEE